MRLQGTSAPTRPISRPSVLPPVRPADRPKRRGPRPEQSVGTAGRGRRIGRNLTPGTPRRIGRYSPPGTENAPKPIGRRLQKAGPSGPSLQQAAMDSGRMAAVVRALTAQVPGLGAGVPLPIPARVALAAATYLLPETGLLNRSTTKRRLGRSTFKR